MSESTKTRLFFFKANSFDLKAVEAYLTKRDYEVMSESIFTEALAKLLHFDPAFVFIAWDHPHERIHTIPRFIAQSIDATVIPYISSTSREHLRELEASGFSLKIYPPVSGPAIIRAILKIEKVQKIAADEAKKSAEPNPAKKSQTTFATSSKKTEAVQSFLADLEKQKPAGSQIFGAGSSATEKSFIHVQKGSRGDLIKYNKTKLASLSHTLSTDPINPQIKTALQFDFQTNIKNQILDVSQSYLEVDGGTESAPPPAVEPGIYRKLLCLVVQSESWCGYLLIASQIEIKNEDYQTILQNWLQSQFINMNEISENDYFEIELENKDVDLKSWVKVNSDYLEIIESNGSEVIISFFSTDPKYLILELSEAYQMLEVPLDFVESDKKIQLSLFLHLPDNKKYILYTPAHQTLSTQQKNKLQEKNVEKLFTPMDFEKELNKLKAEYYLNESVKKNKKDAVQ